MLYSVQFANHRVAGATVPPFSVEVAEHLGSVEREAEFQRLVREHLTAALTGASELSGMNTAADVAIYTQVAADMRDQQGIVYFGSATIGHMTFYPHP